MYVLHIDGKPVKLTAEQIASAIETNPEEAKKIIARMSPEDRMNVARAYNMARKTNYGLEDVNKFAGIQQSDLGTTTATKINYQAPKVETSTIPTQHMTQATHPHQYNVQIIRDNTGNIQQYKIGDTIINANQIHEIMDKYTPEQWRNFMAHSNLALQDLYEGYKQGARDLDYSSWYNKYFVDKPISLTQTITPIGSMENKTQNQIQTSNISEIANKYNVTPDYLINNYNKIKTSWENMSYEDKVKFANQYGLTPDILQKDIDTIGNIINIQPFKTQQQSQQISDIISNMQNNKSIFQVPQIEAPKLTTGFDYKNLQKDLFEGMKSQIMDEYEKQLDRINASASKMGLFRSGLNLKMQEELAKDTEKALAQAWGDSAIKVAQLQAQMAMKQGDWELAARMQNVANQLTQEKITNEMQLGLLNAQLQKYGIDTQTDINKAKLALQKYNIDVDTNTKYDLAALDYLKSMNLARADVMTRVTTSYLQYNMDAYKQLLANKNYKEANTFWVNNLLPLLTTMLPTIVQFTGENPDTEQLQEAYQKIYGIKLDPETINKLIDDVNKLTQEINTLKNHNNNEADIYV